jgi:hypothetical protein
MAEEIFAPLLKFTVALNTAVPAPLMFVPEFSANVPPPNSSLAPDPML